jgi:hypothetical protein
MKLGEALARRSDVQVRIAQVRDRLAATAVVQEGDEPPEPAGALLAELDALLDELGRLIVVINRTNAVTRLPSGATLTEALARRDVLGARHSALTTVIDATTRAQARYSKSEIRMVRTVDVAALRRAADDAARERRELDAEIQQVNWTADMIEEAG